MIKIHIGQRNIAGIKDWEEYNHGNQYHGRETVAPGTELPSDRMLPLPRNIRLPGSAVLYVHHFIVFPSDLSRPDFAGRAVQEAPHSFFMSVCNAPGITGLQNYFISCMAVRASF